MKEKKSEKCADALHHDARKSVAIKELPFFSDYMSFDIDMCDIARFWCDKLYFLLHVSYTKHDNSYDSVCPSVCYIVVYFRRKYAYGHVVFTKQYSKDLVFGNVNPFSKPNFIEIG